jgi:hypothetical protein
MQDTPEAGYGVKRRAASVASSYEWKAHNKVDVPFNGTAPGDVGPMEKAIKDYGRVKPLVFGQFGEICPSLPSSTGG